MLDHLPWRDVDDECAIVEVLDGKLAAGECREEVDLLLDEEVVFLALEAIVGLLLDDDDHVAGGDVGRLIALA